MFTPSLKWEKHEYDADDFFPKSICHYAATPFGSRYCVAFQHPGDAEVEWDDGGIVNYDDLVAKYGDPEAPGFTKQAYWEASLLRVGEHGEDEEVTIESGLHFFDAVRLCIHDYRDKLLAALEEMVRGARNEIPSRREAAEGRAYAHGPLNFPERDIFPKPAK